MIISLEANDPRPLYVQIMDEVRRALVLGTHSIDEPIPSVRGLASELRINPNTVAQAYRELEREGIVEVRRGQGTFLVKANANVSQRRALLRAVVERALRDAHRNGISPDELVQAIRAGAPAHAKRVSA